MEHYNKSYNNVFNQGRYKMFTSCLENKFTSTKWKPLAFIAGLMKITGDFSYIQAFYQNLLE